MVWMEEDVRADRRGMEKRWPRTSITPRQCLLSKGAGTRDPIKGAHYPLLYARFVRLICVCFIPALCLWPPATYRWCPPGKSPFSSSTKRSWLIHLTTSTHTAMRSHSSSVSHLVSLAGCHATLTQGSASSPLLARARRYRGATDSRALRAASPVPPPALRPASMMARVSSATARAFRSRYSRHTCSSSYHDRQTYTTTTTSSTKGG